MSRTAVLTEAQWARLASLLPSSDGRRGRPFRDSRRIVEGILYRYRCGLAWRDVPAEFGPWQTLWKRHRRYAGDGTWDRVLALRRSLCDQLPARPGTRLHPRPHPYSRRDRRCWHPRRPEPAQSRLAEPVPVRTAEWVWRIATWRHLSHLTRHHPSPTSADRPPHHLLVEAFSDRSGRMAGTGDQTQGLPRTCT